MPLPQALARLNKRVTNRVTRRFAGWAPGFAIVVHHGRTSGRRYRTPVNAFRRPGGGYVIALTYGPRPDWARNVLAEGGCTLEARGQRVWLGSPRMEHDPTRALVPPPVRVVLRWLRVDWFLVLGDGPPAA